MTSRTLRISSLTLTALLALSLPLSAQADPITRATLRGELSGYEDAPSAATVRAWGADGALWMMELANDTQEAPFLRARAVSGLRHFAPSEAVHRFLVLTAAQPGDLFVRRAAFDALVAGYGDLASVAPYLDAQQVDLRDGAAWSIAAARSPAGRALLEARLRVETDETVRLTIAAALAQPAAPRLGVTTQVTLPPRAPTRTRR